jgi:peroxiredoxin
MKTWWRGWTGCAVLLISMSMAAQEVRPRPGLEVTTSGGKVLRVQQLKGSVVLLDFMTTVCPSCKAASAGLQRLHVEFGRKGFRPVGIALNVDTPAALTEYVKQNGVTFTMGTASRESVAAYLQHPSGQPFMVPTLVLLDRRGRVQSIDVGWRGEQHLREQIVRLLGK